MTGMSNTLPTYKVSVVARVFSDTEIRSPKAYANAVLRGVDSSQWDMVSCEGQEMVLRTEPQTIRPNTTMDDAFVGILPSWYNTSVVLSYEFRQTIMKQELVAAEAAGVDLNLFKA